MRFENFVRSFSVLSIATSAAAGSNIDFKIGNAVIGGNGCLPGTVEMVVDDLGDLIIDYGELKVDLPAAADDSAALSARSACIVRVPTLIPQGVYVKEISQQALFTLSKSSRSKVSVATRLAIGQIGPESPFVSTFEMGETLENQFIFADHASGLNEAASINFFCNSSRSDLQLLQLNLAISAQRRSSFESVSLQVHSSWIGEGYEIILETCPTGSIE